MNCTLRRSERRIGDGASACGGRPRGSDVRRAVSGAALAATLWASACTGQTAAVTIDPVMARGPEEAPVTIVEFSDYQ
jgi:protein-disulfide isomerase